MDENNRNFILAIVLSMVASSCIPPIAMTAAMNLGDGSHAEDLPVCPRVDPIAVFWDCGGNARFAPPSASRRMAARSASLRAVITSYLTVILGTL